MLIEDGIIKDVRFDGAGCTICFASTSIMSDLIKGKSKEEAKSIIGEYKKMLNEESYDDNGNYKFTDIYNDMRKK